MPRCGDAPHRRSSPQPLLASAAQPRFSQQALLPPRRTMRVSVHDRNGYTHCTSHMQQQHLSREIDVCASSPYRPPCTLKPYPRPYRVVIEGHQCPLLVQSASATTMKLCNHYLMCLYDKQIIGLRHLNELAHADLCMNCRNSSICKVPSESMSNLS